MIFARYTFVLNASSPSTCSPLLKAWSLKWDLSCVTNEHDRKPKWGWWNNAITEKIGMKRTSTLMKNTFCYLFHMLDYVNTMFNGCYQRYYYNFVPFFVVVSSFNCFCDVRNQRSAPSRVYPSVEFCADSDSAVRIFIWPWENWFVHDFCIVLFGLLVQPLSTNH